jgi:hypothetical protein
LLNILHPLAEVEKFARIGTIAMNSVKKVTSSYRGSKIKFNITFG